MSSKPDTSLAELVDQLLTAETANFLIDKSTLEHSDEVAIDGWGNRVVL